MAAQYLTQSRVRAFDLVGCRGHQVLPGGVQVGEQQPLPDEPVEAVTGAHEPFMGIHGRPLGGAYLLCQEVLPARTPVLVVGKPLLGSIDILHVQELASKSV